MNRRRMKNRNWMQFSILIIYNASQPLQQVQIVKSVLRLGQAHPWRWPSHRHRHTGIRYWSHCLTRSLAPMHCHALLTSRKFTLQLPESTLWAPHRNFSAKQHSKELERERRRERRFLCSSWLAHPPSRGSHPTSRLFLRINARNNILFWPSSKDWKMPTNIFGSLWRLCAGHSVWLPDTLCVCVCLCVSMCVYASVACSLLLSALWCCKQHTVVMLSLNIYLFFFVPLIW